MIEAPQGVTLADDAGPLLVRAGLIENEHLLIARQAHSSHGGTIGEHLVLRGFLDDEELTNFFRTRLMVPRIHPTELTDIPAKVIARLPADMAVEFRVIPVTIDREGNLIVAMSDPTNSHAVDEIQFFTGSYVVRAVATQVQVAWCLARYYGFVTPLARGVTSWPRPSSTPPCWWLSTPGQRRRAWT